MTTTNAAVEVTEADRDAAAKLYELLPGLSSSRDEGLKTAEFIRSGGGDGWNTVQAFAIHRLAHTQPAEIAGREGVARAAYEGHVVRNKPWHLLGLNERERWQSSADAILKLRLAPEGWMPIETAPHRGAVLGFVPENREVNRIVTVQMKDGKPFIANGSFAFDMHPITHWRPLPPAPSAPDREAE